MRLRFLALFLFAYCILGHQTYTYGQITEDIVTVDICIVNDANVPVNGAIIESLLKEVSQIYLEQAHIRLRVVAHAVYHGDIDKGPKQFVEDMEKAYSKKHVAKILFTNRTFLLVEYAPGDYRFIRGVTIPSDQAAIIFLTELSCIDFTSAGESQALATLRHEIGHILGLLDSKDPQSFMYSPTADSAGQFTKADLEGLQKYRESHK